MNVLSFEFESYQKSNEFLYIPIKTSKDILKKNSSCSCPKRNITNYLNVGMKVETILSIKINPP